MAKLIEKKILKYQSKGKTPYMDSEYYQNTPELDGKNQSAFWLNQTLGANQLEGLKSKDLGFQNTYLTQDNSTQTPEENTDSKSLSDAGKNYQNQLKYGFKNQLGFNFQTSPKNPYGAIMSLIKPVIATGSALLNLQQLKKTRDAALNLKSPRVQPGLAPVRPIQGLAPEITDLYTKNLAGMQVKKTADATSNRIAEQMLDSNKMGALDKLSAVEVDNLFKERQRHDQLEAMNAQETAKASNDQEKYDADIENKKASVNAAYEAAKQDFTNKWIDEALVQPIEKRVSHNIGVQTIQNSEEWNRLQTMIIDRQNVLHQQPANQAVRRELNDLLEKQKSISKRDLPSYDESMKYLFTSK